VLEQQHVLDMNHFEESTGCPRVFVALQPNVDSLPLVLFHNRLAPEAFEALLAVAQEGCVKVYGEMQLALNARVKQLAVGRGAVNT